MMVKVLYYHLHHTNLYQLLMKHLLVFLFRCQLKRNPILYLYQLIRYKLKNMFHTNLFLNF